MCSVHSVQITNTVRVTISITVYRSNTVASRSFNVPLGQLLTMVLLKSNRATITPFLVPHSPVDAQHTLMKHFRLCSVGSIVREKERDSECSTTIHQTYNKSNGSRNVKATTNGPFKLRYKNKLVDWRNHCGWKELCLQKQRTTADMQPLVIFPTLGLKWWK